MRQHRDYRRLKGYKYVLDALKIIKDDEKKFYQLMCVYKTIATKNGVTTDSVRMAISRFIKKRGYKKAKNYLNEYIYKKF
jgi:hypothetical protein